MLTKSVSFLLDLVFYRVKERWEQMYGVMRQDVRQFSSVTTRFLCSGNVTAD